jgi:hypothetical protein
MIFIAKHENEEKGTTTRRELPRDDCGMRI